MPVPTGPGYDGGMTRVRSSPSPLVATPARTSAAPKQPQAPTATAAGWKASGGAKKPGLLDGLKGTLVTPARQDGGPAKFPRTVAGVPVASATVVHFDGLTGKKALMQQGVEVKFGKLSQAQFDALKAEFGGASKVPYDAKREYTAVDFLPPALQALVFKDLDTGKTVELKGTAKLREPGEGDYTISLDPNCHGTAWEAMRAFQGQATGAVSLHFGDATTADGHYVDEKRFTPLGSAKPGEAPAFLSQLKPGDVVRFDRYQEGFGNMELLHSAVYVGGGLFFEKPDTEMDEYSETPYRLVTYEQVKAPIVEAMGEDVAPTALRPKVALEAGTTAFAFSDDGKLEGWAAKKGVTLGRPLVVELEMGMGGGVRGFHASAVDTRQLRIGSDGRGVLE
ncbi:MAG: hypothetical protein AB1938_14355 [Myxococcota bacterium]